MWTEIKRHWHARMWIRGTSRLGIINTLFAVFANKVFVRHVRSAGHYWETSGWEIIEATD